MNIEFYSTKDDTIKLNKTLTLRTVYQGNFLKDCEMDYINPIITIRQNFLPFDFVLSRKIVYIPNLKRYYYIINAEALSNTTVKLRLKLDVLDTYKKIILKSIATVIESENGNKYLSNVSDVHDIRPNFQKLEFSETTPFKKNIDNNIIMITTKGNINQTQN